MIKNNFIKISLSIISLSIINAFLFWKGPFSLTDSFNFEWLVFSIFAAIFVVGIYHSIFRYLAIKYDLAYQHEFVEKGALLSFIAALFHFPIVVVSREHIGEIYAKKHITKNYEHQKEGYIYFLGNILFLLFLTVLIFFQSISFFKYVFLSGAIFAFWQIVPFLSLSYIKMKAMYRPFLWISILNSLWFIVLLSGLLANLFAIFAFLILALYIVFMVYYKIPNR